MSSLFSILGVHDMGRYNGKQIRRINNRIILRIPSIIMQYRVKVTLQMLVFVSQWERSHQIEGQQSVRSSSEKENVNVHIKITNQKQKENIKETSSRASMNLKTITIAITSPLKHKPSKSRSNIKPLQKKTKTEPIKKRNQKALTQTVYKGCVSKKQPASNCKEETKDLDKKVCLDSIYLHPTAFSSTTNLPTHHCQEHEQPISFTSLKDIGSRRNDITKQSISNTLNEFQPKYFRRKDYFCKQDDSFDKKLKNLENSTLSSEARLNKIIEKLRLGL